MYQQSPQWILIQGLAGHICGSKGELGEDGWINKYGSHDVSTVSILESSPGHHT